MVTFSSAVRTVWARPSLLVALATFVLHMLANGRYGFFRDELYFIVCGQHLDWGYVDQPPLIPLIAAGAFGVFGKALVLFRIPAALAMAGLAALTAEFTRGLHGGRTAQALAGLCSALAPFFLMLGTVIYTDMLQALCWLGIAWCLIRLAETKDERWWLALALIAVIGFYSKYAIVFYIAALAAGLPFTPLRRSLAKPWIYAAAALGLVLVLPNVWWQHVHGWPFRELTQAATGQKNLAFSPLDFFARVALFGGPVALPVWLAGLWAFAVKPRQAVERLFPIAFAVLGVFFIVTHSKPYYLVNLLPILFAGGAVFLEGYLHRWARPAALAAVCGGGAVLAPIGMPLLTEDGYTRYAAAIGIGPSATWNERMKVNGQLPQFYADMHGWSEIAAKVGAAARALPPEERGKAVFLANNSGEAAAVDVLGGGIPPAICGHNNYYLWGLRGHDGSVVIALGGTRADREAEYRSVTVVGEITDPYAMWFERGQAIYVLREPKTPLAAGWAARKLYW